MIANFLARLFSPTPKDRVLRPGALQRAIEREQALIAEYARRIPWIPLVQQRTGQDDSALGTASFAGLEARPRRLILTGHPAVTYVELAFRYASSAGEVYAANLGRARLYARLEDPLWLAGASHTVEQIRARDKLRDAYFSRVFALMAAQSDCNLDLGEWPGSFLLPEDCEGGRDWLASIQNFNHDIAADRGRPGAGLEAFRAAVHGFDFARQAPRLGPVSLRMSVRPHEREDGRYSQSITHVFLGSSRGIAFRKSGGKVEFLAPGHVFERRFESFVRQAAAGRLAHLKRRSWRRSAEERVWGGPGECEAYFHNHDRFFMKGRAWRLERDADNNPRVMGTHRNVAAFSCGEHRVAVKAVPFESVGDLVRLVQ
ncbi:MAG: hypothetical protein GVY33_04215, partial [Alphaproteobacteria bacterium]|nr:hypothetical protein [Alphaproteobacteria bacterium]